MKFIAIFLFFMLATSSISAVAFAYQEPFDESIVYQNADTNLQQNDDVPRSEGSIIKLSYCT